MTPSRRTAMGALAATLITGATTPIQKEAAAAQAAPPPADAPFTLPLGESRLHRIQTGWVSVKESHRRLEGPAFLRLPAILTDRRWTPWLPITAYLIEHGGRRILVDTGETAAIARSGYTACDSGTGWFYDRNLRFAVSEEDELGPQLRSIGVPPESVDTVIMTHLHSDHMGGMRWTPQAEFLISSADRGGHRGALPCREPKGIRRRAVYYGPDPVGAFAGGFAVTPDGAVSIAPTPGHTPGHQSVLLSIAGLTLLLAGDAVFSEDQVARGEIAGIVEDAGAARRTLRVLAEQRRRGAVLLPTHDPDAGARLARLA